MRLGGAAGLCADRFGGHVVSDDMDTDDIEAAWERRRQVEELRERGLAGREETIAALARRQAEGPASTWKPPEPERRPAAGVEQPMRSSNWDAVQSWTEKIIDQHIGTTTKSWTIKQIEDVTVALAEEAGNLMAELRSQLRGELKAAVDAAKAEITSVLGELRTEFDRRLVELQHRAEIAALERRVAEAERASPAPRSTVPRLIAGGSTDAAD
jgi:BMFP domain-containing protein YqiC